MDVTGAKFSCFTKNIYKQLTNRSVITEYRTRRFTRLTCLSRLTYQAYNRCKNSTEQCFKSFYASFNIFFLTNAILFTNSNTYIYTYNILVNFTTYTVLHYIIHALLYNTILKNIRKHYETTYNAILMLGRTILILQCNCLHLFNCLESWTIFY